MLSAWRKSKIFFVGNLSFILGIAVLSISPVWLVDYRFYFFILFIIFLVFIYIFWNNLRIRIIGLFIVLFFLGIWRIGLGLAMDQNNISRYQGKNITFTGLISKEPEVKLDKQKLVVKAVDISLNKNSYKNKTDGLVLIFTELYPNYKYGDQLIISCQLQKSEPFGEFDYERYLARYDIYTICYYPQIKILGRGLGNQFYNIIFKIKDKARQLVERNLPAPESDLALGIILGDTSGFGQDLQTAFSRSGLSHLTAVSGMNITLIAALVMNILFFCGFNRRWAFYFATGTLLVYVLLVGAPASALRAGLMGFLVLWSLYLGRMNKSINALILTVSLLLLWNPKLLIADIGFQLSFLAMSSIIYIYPVVNSIFDKFKIPTGRGLRDAVSLSLSAQIFTAPIIAYNFFQISLVSLLANVMVVWASSLLMILIIFALILSTIKPLGIFLFLPVLVLAKYIIMVAQWSSGLSWATITLNYFSPLWLVLYYAVLFILIRLCNKYCQMKNEI